MKEDKFIKQNAEVWKRLEATLGKLKSKGLQRFENGELDDFISLYNRTCGHLSYSRTNYGNTSTTAYLNSLVASASGCIYTTKTSNLKNMLRFIAWDFPLLLRKNLLFLALSTGIFLAGMLISFIYTLLSPENASVFVPDSILEGIRFGKESNAGWNGTIMSSVIFTNNIRVGLTAFAMGITLGIGTVYALVTNSFLLGGLGALALQARESLSFWALILPHGILELFCIFVCGAAGLMIGHSLIAPGHYTRKDAFILRGKSAIQLLFATVPLFVVAGLIEGYFTPLPLPREFKLAFAVFTLLALLAYLIYPNWKSRRNS
jgi:uncharacterized membrane protein SpoIIM required for sporulation